MRSQSLNTATPAISEPTAVAASHTSPRVPLVARGAPSSMTVRRPAIACVMNSELAIGADHDGIRSSFIAAALKNVTSISTVVVQASVTARVPLNRARIVTAALRHVDEHGLAELSMHRLGAERGVKAMSLYKHVDDKDDVLNGIVEQLWATFEREFESGPLDEQVVPVLRTVTIYTLGYGLTELNWFRAAAPECAPIGRDLVPPGADEELLANADVFCGNVDMAAQFELGLELMLRGLDRCPPSHS